MVDIGDHTIRAGKEIKRIEPKAMHVLYLLAVHAGDTVERSELLREVWNGRVVVEEALTRIISQLRQALDDSKQRRLIQTVPKKGYRLRGEVSWQNDTNASNPPTAKTTPASASGKPAIPVKAEEPAPQPEPAPLTVEQNTPTAKKEQHLSPAPTVSIKSVVVAFTLFIMLAITAFFVNHTLRSNTDSAAVQQRIAVAVLPLRQLSNDNDTLYFADGITEELADSLTRNQNLDVPSRYSTLAATNSNAGNSLSEVASTLNVRYLVEGSVRRIDDEFKIAVRLVDAGSDRVVWSESYTNTASGLFAIQQNIARQINQALLPQNSATPIVDATVDNVEAYQYYLRGNYWLMNGKTSEWFYQSEAAFKKAVEIDPDFAAAHGKLAYIYARHDFHDAYMPAEEALDKANAAIATALQSNPTDTNALLARVLIATAAGNFGVAEQTLNAILERSPEHTAALYIYSELELARNQFDAALERAQQAYELDPLSPWINVNLAIVHFWRGEFSKALTAVERAISIDSNYTWAYVWRAKAYHRQGNINGALASMQRSADIDPASPVNSAYTGLLFMEAGDTAQADNWFKQTASLLGDSPQARFWQGFLRFARHGEAPEVARQLMLELPLLDNRIFSLLPLVFDNYITTQETGALADRLADATAPQGSTVNIYTAQRFAALDALDALTTTQQQQLDSLVQHIGNNATPLAIYYALNRQPQPDYLQQSQQGWLDYRWLAPQNPGDDLLRVKLQQ
ncbi:hypothetical protein GCM10011338_03260 [Alteromonas lipolytica]|uniref:OmpR/PhoB-type domain-containing protein n=1 Tax=Alteromonas lipolytica TaxID=1856405 RepID=A0A1E8FFY5_9ALTE|nr:hypothetical protein BFC17_14795 [Alteromonas lipolytica]GGF54410.1 hypothetical protein GCM10011338_03260 [Alteromonas lipolytica]